MFVYICSEDPYPSTDKPGYSSHKQEGRYPWPSLMPFGSIQCHLAQVGPSVHRPVWFLKSCSSGKMFSKKLDAFWLTHVSQTQKTVWMLRSQAGGKIFTNHLMPFCYGRLKPHPGQLCHQVLGRCEHPQPIMMPFDSAGYRLPTPQIGSSSVRLGGRHPWSCQ